MYNNEKLKTKIKEIEGFNSQLKKYVTINSQINIDSNLIEIYNKYDLNLRIIFDQLVKCNKALKEEECIRIFSDNFQILQSNISKSIENKNI
jgi:hypothetical protein